MKCKNCGKENPLGSRGRTRKFCSQKCNILFIWRDKEKMSNAMKLSHINHPNRAKCASDRMKVNNPMWIPGIKEKAIKTNKRLGTKPIIRGGNGQEMPVPQRVLLSALGKGWYGEHIVCTKRIIDKIPFNYKIDIANPKKKIAIEVDGYSHNLLKRKEQDNKKDKCLKLLGWKVIRFKNKEVMLYLDACLNRIYAKTRS